MADKQPPVTTMPPVTLPPAGPPVTTPPPTLLVEGAVQYAPSGSQIAFGEADEKKFSIGFKQEGKGGTVNLLVNHPNGKVESYSAGVSPDGGVKGTSHGGKTDVRIEDSIKDWALKLRTNEREQAAKAGPIIALAKKIYNQDSPGIITEQEFRDIYKAFQALGPAEVPNSPVPPVTEPPMTTLPPPPPMTTLPPGAERPPRIRWTGPLTDASDVTMSSKFAVNEANHEEKAPSAVPNGTNNGRGIV